MNGESELSKPQREMIALHVSTLNACHYCVGAHRAAVAGLLAVGGAFLVLTTMVGFLAIGLLGLVVLVIANRVDIDDGHAIAEIQQSAATVRLVALQMAERDRTAADRRPALAAERRRRRLALSIARTFGVALTALGFSTFYLHQL